MKIQICFLRLSRSAFYSSDENTWDCCESEGMDIAFINFTGDISELALNVIFQFYVVATSVRTVLCQRAHRPHFRYFPKHSDTVLTQMITNLVSYS
jgi:hypothetical protein